MTTVKRLGIWLDHAAAHLIPYTGNPVETETLESEFTYEEKQRSLHRGESQMHQKEQQQQAAYYKKIGEVIKNYNEVVLFGPTDAKIELLNMLRADHHFDQIKMETQQTDSMTDNQEHAFVREYFSKNN
jgi:hypothetical protein